MSTAIAVRFPTGRYHATPWGRSVNEAAIEWPPSPWRVLRGLYATWRWRAPELDSEVVEAALAGLVVAPSFRLPRHVEAHTRHYYPDAAYSTDKVFDPFAALDPRAELVMRWQNELDEAARAALGRLCGLLPYLGRADSLCQARLLSREESEKMGPEGWSEPGDLGALDRPGVRVLAPVSPLDVAALLATTTAVRRAGRTTPTGARWISYPPVSSAVPPSFRRVSTRAVPVAAVRLALAAPALPTVRQAVLYGHALRRAAMSREPSATLSGRDDRIDDGVRRDGHVHAHYLFLDSDRDGLLDTAVVWAPEGLSEKAVGAIGRIRQLHFGEPGFRPVRMAIEAGGSVTEVVPELVGPSRRWFSVTPFAPYRYPKRQDVLEFLTSEVGRELASRELPPPQRVRVLAGDWLTYRRHRRPGEDDLRAFGLELTFASEVVGPVALGALSHFGLGLFRPVS